MGRQGGVSVGRGAESPRQTPGPDGQTDSQTDTHTHTHTHTRQNLYILATWAVITQKEHSVDR